MAQMGEIKYKYNAEGIRQEKEVNGRKHIYYTQGTKTAGGKDNGRRAAGYQQAVSLCGGKADRFCVEREALPVSVQRGWESRPRVRCKDGAYRRRIQLYGVRKLHGNQSYGRKHR